MNRFRMALISGLAVVSFIGLGAVTDPGSGPASWPTTPSTGTTTTVPMAPSQH